MPNISTTNYISQADFQAYHPETDVSQYTATTLSGILGQASRYVDNFCQVDGFDFQIVTSEKSQAIITNEGDLLIYPRRPPITAGSISAITLHRGTFNLTLTLQDGAGNTYLEYPTHGLNALYPNTYLTAVGTFTITNLSYLRGRTIFVYVTYTGGYQNIPDPIKNATASIARDIINRRINALGASEIQQGGIRIKYGPSTDGKSADLLTAENILQDYVRRTPT